MLGDPIAGRHHINGFLIALGIIVVLVIAAAYLHRKRSPRKESTGGGGPTYRQKKDATRYGVEKRWGPGV